MIFITKFYLHYPVGRIRKNILFYKILRLIYRDFTLHSAISVFFQFAELVSRNVKAEGQIRDSATNSEVYLSLTLQISCHMALFGLIT
jgi:hypothetical protein